MPSTASAIYSGSYTDTVTIWKIILSNSIENFIFHNTNIGDYVVEDPIPSNKFYIKSNSGGSYTPINSGTFSNNVVYYIKDISNHYIQAEEGDRISDISTNLKTLIETIFNNFSSYLRNIDLESSGENNFSLSTYYSLLFFQILKTIETNKNIDTADGTKSYKIEHNTKNNCIKILIQKKSKNTTVYNTITLNNENELSIVAGSDTNESIKIIVVNNKAYVRYEVLDSSDGYAHAWRNPDIGTIIYTSTQNYPLVVNSSKTYKDAYRLNEFGTITRIEK